MKANILTTLFLLISATFGSDVTFEDNGYKNVIVSISPDTDAANAQAIIDGIKSWVIQGSEKLWLSTGRLAYISQVTILLPQAWTNIQAESSGDIAYEDGAIRVEIGNPCYGDAPYTVQNSACRERGDRIMVTPDYLINLDGLATTYYGPPSNIFVHEWAKFRYGVFEEYGYPGDEVYPLFVFKDIWNAEQSEFVAELVPNFCTNERLQGHREDMVDGGACSFNDDDDDDDDNDDGLPDEDCIFIPDGDNSNIRSSLMAAPFLAEVNHQLWTNDFTLCNDPLNAVDEQFCEPGESDLHHDRSLPTRQNAMCDRRDTWTVIEENIDFVDVNPMVAESVPDTNFTIVRPQEGQFVMVLDVSGSMSTEPNDDPPTRLDKLIQSTIRWTQYDIRNGSYLGVTTFSTLAQQVYPMTEINDQSRDDISTVLAGLQSDGWTCLGAGVRQGLATLAVTNPNGGGVMIFLTDGEHKCRFQDGAQDITDLDDPDLIQEIIDSKVRIVTIAFGGEADPKLENLATITNGKTYFISDDSDVEEINDALQGCLTYQPSVRTEDMEIVVFSDQFRGFTAATAEFIIDRTVGREVVFKMDYQYPENGNQNIQEIYIINPDGSELALNFVDDAVTRFFSGVIGNLEEGSYSFRVETTNEAPYANVLITSKAKADELPFTTRCWANAVEADLEIIPLVIYAEVKQGNRPVMNAHVRAEIEKEGQSAAIDLDLFDNGSGADLVANDGLYSRYFARYEYGDGRYLIKCQVSSTDESEVNGGFINSRNFLKDAKAYPINGASTPPCCGSTTVNADTIREPTGAFSRQASGGSVKLSNVPSAGTDRVNPGRIIDLKLARNVATKTIVITFTSPGDDFDEGIVANYDIRMGSNFTEILDNFDNADPLNTTWIMDGYNMTPVAAHERKEIRLTYDDSMTGDILFVAVKGVDEAGLAGPLSNVPFVYLDKYAGTQTPPSKGLSGGEIAGIVIGAVLGAFLIVAAVYFVVIKRRKGSQFWP